MRNEHRLLLIPRPLIDLEALAGFILFLLFLAAGLLFILYKLAFAILPALVCALGFLFVVAVIFHIWSRATIRMRTTEQIARIQSEIRRLERRRAPRDQVWPLETRVRESAQAQVDSLGEELRRLSRSSRAAKIKDCRTIERAIEEHRVLYGVVPDTRRWDRLVRLHLERPLIRWMGSHPGIALALGVVIIAAMTTVVAAGLNRLGLS